MKELTDFSSEESLSAVVDDDSKPKLTAINSSHSEFGGYVAAAVPNVESTAVNKASAGSRCRSKEQSHTVLSEGRDNSVGIKTSSKLSRRGSKCLKRKRKKVSTRSTRAAAKDVAKCSASGKLSTVDISIDEYSARSATEYSRNVQKIGKSVERHQSVHSHAVNEPVVNFPTCTCNNVLMTDDTRRQGVNMHHRTAAELPSSDIKKPTSATCGSSEAIMTAENQGTVVGSPDEPECAHMPTPQKNQLRFLSEELFSLNQESAHITTHMHRRSGTTPRRDQNREGGGNRRSLSTPRKYNVLASDSKSNSRSPRSTPRKVNSGQKSPWKVKFSFSTTLSKSGKVGTKTPSSKRKSPRSSSVLKFPTPNKKQTKRKLYAESPEHDARKPAKVSRYVLVGL